MDINNVLRADYLDIIFDGRNKSYGGYELRRKYARRSLRAMGLITVAAAIGFAVPVIASGLQPKTIVPKMTEVITPMLPDLPVERPAVPLPPPPPPRRGAVEPPSTIAMTPPRIVNDRDVDQPLPEKADLRDKDVAISTTTGGGTPGTEIGPEGPGSGRGVDGVETKVARVPPVKFVEQMPEFRGDLTSWLSAHLRYPDAARETGAQGRSLIEFIVNEDGSIEAARVVRSAHPLLDAEALRVVSAMPKWKPGKQNGTAVRVLFTLPIGFELN